jgi:glycosyltransferase involved in cell wall biosynthesis
MSSASASSDCNPLKLSVVIPHYNDVVRLRRCLEALTVQDCSGAEIVVADNATPAGLGELPNDFPSVRFITEPQKGAASARNAGVAATSAAQIAFLDADCVPASDWLARAYAAAGAVDEAVRGGQVTVFDETPPPRSGAEAFENVFAFNQKEYITRKGFSVTANLLVPRSVFIAVGPFVQSVSEDLEWCRRATSAGYRLVYDPLLRVAHPTRSNWPELKRKWRRLTEESFALQERGPRARAAWALRAMGMLPSAVWHLPRLWRHTELSFWERLLASVTLVRLRATRMVWMLVQAFSGRRELPAQVHSAMPPAG